MSEQEVQPRHVRRIVFGYVLDDFPGALIVGYQQLKRKIERAGYDIVVSMSPLVGDLSDTDMIFVAAELQELARRLAPGARIQIVENFLGDPSYDELIKQLDLGNELTAAKRDENAGEDKIVRYIGYQRIE